MTLVAHHNRKTNILNYNKSKHINFNWFWSDGTTENENNSQTYSATFINTVQQIWIILLITISGLYFSLLWTQCWARLQCRASWIYKAIGERECSVLIKISMKSWGSLIPADKHLIKLLIERNRDVLFNLSLFAVSGCFLPCQSVSIKFEHWCSFRQAASRNYRHTPVKPQTCYLMSKNMWPLTRKWQFNEPLSCWDVRQVRLP